MPTIEDEIRAKTQAFASDLAVLVRRAALEAAAAALGGGAMVPVPTPPATKRGRGRPRKVPAVPVSVASAPTETSKPPSRPVSKPAAAKRAPGAKRPPAELAALIEKVGEYINAHPGAHMEAISKALGTPAKDLRFPVVKLIRAKKARTEGRKQSTAYFPT